MESSAGQYLMLVVMGFFEGEERCLPRFLLRSRSMQHEGGEWRHRLFRCRVACRLLLFAVTSAIRRKTERQVLRQLLCQSL